MIEAPERCRMLRLKMVWGFEGSSLGLLGLRQLIPTLRD